VNGVLRFVTGNVEVCYHFDLVLWGTEEGCGMRYNEIRKRKTQSNKINIWLSEPVRVKR
jgi:hypothetical protein